jgi:microcystin-dependent protein
MDGMDGMDGADGQLQPPGTTDGDILVWDGNNWVAQQPPADTEQDNMQPWLALNYSIALVGLFPSRNSAEPLLGEIQIHGFNYPPRGWAFCNGQLLAIVSNAALFALLGTTYGGDGRNTFALPDLRGRAPIHFGDGPGLTPRSMGAKGGVETH